MLTGFNTNFRYRGVLFHVQTEDSGRSNPHVITHLFHGGNILASHKRDYSEILTTSQDLEADVRALMEGQHKAMLKSLKRGFYDKAISQRLGPAVFPDGSATETEDETLPPEAVAAPPVRPPPPPPRLQESPKERMARAFGDGVVSNKPLDEVVLEYLVENARKRKKLSK